MLALITDLAAVVLPVFLCAGIGWVWQRRKMPFDSELVSRMARAYIRGSQSAGAMATAKHFPGHGDTSVDSHLELPSIDVDRARLDQIELPPFRAAIEEGIVPGGGVALLNARGVLDKLKAEGEDAKVGVSIVRKALEMPMRRIAQNAGQDGSVIVDGVLRQQAEKKSKTIGYDVIAEDFVDMVEKGWIDPAKVTRGALENAASIAAMILTTEALVTDKPEEHPAPAPGGGHMPEY